LADIQLLAITFLCTRVARSTKEDWAKLQRVLEYLHGTIAEFLTIGADDMSIMNTWIDTSYAVHPDMKSHTGGAVSFGTGATLSKSSKQKLNTKSSTEAELVGASVTICHFQSGQKKLWRVVSGVQVDGKCSSRFQEIIPL
jgi:hypothetical protein